MDVVPIVYGMWRWRRHRPPCLVLRLVVIEVSATSNYVHEGDHAFFIFGVIVTIFKLVPSTWVLAPVAITVLFPS